MTKMFLATTYDAVLVLCKVYLMTALGATADRARHLLPARTMMVARRQRVRNLVKDTVDQLIVRGLSHKAARDMNRTRLQVTCSCRGLGVCKAKLPIIEVVLGHELKGECAASFHCGIVVGGDQRPRESFCRAQICARRV
jgi:hypothetical protein